MTDARLPIHVGIYQCIHCNHVFDAPGLIEDSTNIYYGYFMYYAKAGNITVFQTMGDPIAAPLFKEFTALIQKHQAEYPELTYRPVSILLAATLNPAPDGSAYHFRPYCPNCDRADTQLLNPRLNEQRFVESGVQPVAPSFEHWLSLSETEQIQRILDYARELITQRLAVRRIRFPYAQVRHTRLTLDNDKVLIGKLPITGDDELVLDEDIGMISASELRPSLQERETLTKHTCQPQLAAYLFAITRKPRLMNHYFPITHVLDKPAEADFHRLIVSIAQNPALDIHLTSENRQDRTNNLPPDAGYLVAGHIAEIFFYRRDLLDQFLTKRRGFFLYTTPQAYHDDGGVAGGCYNPQRVAIQLVLSRLYEGFYAPTPGVAPFIHEFGHMLDHATGNRGLIPGMNEHLDLFRRGKQLEIDRSNAFHNRRGGLPPIGHPYVFQNDGEFIAGYLEMFFRNPNYFAALNADLYQAFAQCLKQDPRQSWKEDFPFYVQQNRDYYANQRPPKPGLTLPKAL